MPKWGKAMNENDSVFGFVAGILILGALFVWLLKDVIWVVPLSLFVMGMLTFFDVLFPYGRQVYAFSMLGGIIAGCFAVLFANAYGFLFWILAAASIAFVLILASKLFRRISR